MKKIGQKAVHGLRLLLSVLPASMAVAPVPAVAQSEDAAWNQLLANPSIEELAAFIEAYPEGQFADAAFCELYRLSDLAGQGAADEIAAASSGGSVDLASCATAFGFTALQNA